MLSKNFLCLHFPLLYTKYDKNISQQSNIEIKVNSQKFIKMGACALNLEALHILKIKIPEPTHKIPIVTEHQSSREPHQFLQWNSKLFYDLGTISIRYFEYLDSISEVQIT